MQAKGPTLLLDSNWRVESAVLAASQTPPKMQPCGPTSGFLLRLSLRLVLGRWAAFSRLGKPAPV